MSDVDKPAGHLGLAVVAAGRPRGVGRMDSRTPPSCRCLSSSNGSHRWSSRSPKLKASPWPEAATVRRRRVAGLR